MKTNKFENTIRRKLESIEPDFQEQDWARMQNYMQTHTPPSFLQQYGSWIGYAAAASVTSVMAYMYVNQLSQNDNLVRDVKNLQSQIEVIKNQPQVTKTDTVYLLQSTPDGQGLRVTEIARGDYQPAAKPNYQPQKEIARNEATTRDVVSPAAGQSTTKPESAAAYANAAGSSAIQEENAGAFHAETQRRNPVLAQQPSSDAGNAGYGSSQPENTGAHNATGVPGTLGGMRSFGADFEVSSIDSPLDLNAGIALKRKMNYDLASKLSSRQVQKALVANHIQIAKAPAAAIKKAEQVAQAESVIPKLPIKTPYRFGAGYQIESNGHGTTVMGEVIVKKKFSISAGITWLKVKPAEFFTETIFREKARQDFKETHPGQVPLIFKVYNIKIDQSVVQMPLTVAFRNTVKDDWAYYGSMGTNIKLSSKETVSFDCRGPKNEFFNQTFDKKADVSPITSMNFAVGIEKSWHPIVVQAEGYWVNYFKPMTPLRHSAGPGLKVKLLYQIGQHM